MLVSVVMPIMSIYRLPLGQYGYTGHIINLPQDVVTFAHSLPRLPSEVDVLIVRKDYQQGQMNSTQLLLLYHLFNHFHIPTTCPSSFRIIHVIGTHTRYARPNDVYVTLVIYDMLTRPDSRS